MRRRRIAIMIGLCALGGLAVLRVAGVRAMTGGSRDGDDVPVVTVSKTSFAHRVTAEGNLRAVEATPVVVPQIEGLWGALKVAWLAPDGAPVKAGDVIVRFDRTEAEKQLRDLRVEVDAADVRLREEQLRTAVSHADKALSATRARQQVEQARQFQAKDPLLFSRKEIALGELDDRVATARQVQAERAEQTDRQVGQANVDLVALARQRAVLALGHAETALASFEIHAPNDGILVFTRDAHGDVPKLGAQMWPNEAIAELPVPGAMEAELFVLEVDGNGLDVDAPADVVVESHPERTFHGKIRLVDKLAKPREPGVPVQYLSAVVALDQTDREVMKPGQRVQATLVLGRQDAIVVPRLAVFEKDGKTVVYRRGEHGFAPVTVELGAATPARVAIASGLAEGDVIALRDPTRSLDEAIGSGSAAAPVKGTP
jgi:HlyD family secretion protein